MNTSNNQLTNWTPFETPHSLAEQLVTEVLFSAKDAIEKRGAFHLLVSVGSSVEYCFQLLAQQKSDWPYWHIYLADELVLPAADPHRKSQRLMGAWLNHVRIPSANIHMIPTELGVEVSALHHAQMLAKLDTIDFGLMGVGNDGHVLGLFPETDEQQRQEVIWLGKQPKVNNLMVIDHRAPGLASQRVSMHYGAFFKCQRLVKIIIGEQKQIAMRRWIEEETTQFISSLPIARIHGQVTQIYISQEAMP